MHGRRPLNIPSTFRMCGYTQPRSSAQLSMVFTMTFHIDFSLGRNTMWHFDPLHHVIQG